MSWLSGVGGRRLDSTENITNMAYKRRKKTEAFCFHITIILSALQAFWVLYLPVSIALRLHFAVFYKYKYKNKLYSKGIWLQYEQSVDICTDVVRTLQEPFMLKLASFPTYCKLRRRLRKITRITWFFQPPLWISLKQFIDTAANCAMKSAIWPSLRAICREPMEKGPRGEILRMSTHVKVRFVFPT